ncbi:MAG: ABC transporter ATP-binding protein [Candidatus Woesebacteria bacterium]|jgi:ATP-binding cassette subfamily B protein
MFKIYKIYYRFLLHYKKQFFLFLIALVSFSIFQSIQPYFYKLFIDAIPSANYQRLFQILAIYILVRILELVSDVFTRWWGDCFLLPAARDARLAVFKKIQDLDFAFHLTKSTGSLISAIKRGDLAFFSIHHVINIRISKIAISFLVILIFFSQIHWTVALLMLLSFVVNLLVAYFLVKKNIKARKEFNRAEDKISAIIVDNLLNFETVKLFAKEDLELKRLKKQFENWLARLWSYANSFRFIDVSVGGIGNLALFFILLFSLKEMAALRFTPGEYIMILGFISTFYPRFFELIYEVRNLAKHQVDIQKYFSVLNKKTLVNDPAQPVEKASVKGEIEFRNVSFSYPEGKQDALNNINLHIRQGQSVAFVGHSGVGKTTIAKLLMRFYDPEQGAIYLDGINIKDFTKDRLRSFMGVVPQDPILFNNTIAFNIAYGADNVTQEELIAATKMANLNDFIETLPKKYETQVGERGVKLSGGQKQRLAIARMILSNPDIIIFDEATSQLDSESEKKIQDAFWKAAKNKTTLIIAHRLSSIVKAEKIVVMEEGSIKEIGSHRDLLTRKDSLYSRFWRLQTIATAEFPS